MVAQQFPYQRASFPFHLCDPLLDKFTSQTEAAVLALRAIRYLGHSAIYSALFFFPPLYSCRDFSNHEFSEFTQGWVKRTPSGTTTKTNINN